MNLAEKDLVDLAFNGLRSHIKEKLEGNDFFAVNQVHQRVLAAESEVKSCKKVIDIIVPILMLLSIIQTLQTMSLKKFTPLNLCGHQMTSQVLVLL